MTETDETTAGAAPGRPRPWWHWGQLMRGRLRPALAAAVAGALLGGTGIAWQAQAGPFEQESACWGSLSGDDVADLFEGEDDIETSAVPTRDRYLAEGAGVCRLQTEGGPEITARVHKLSGRFGGDRDAWADEYLSARMTPLGGGLLGMASDSRAWLAIPESCVGRRTDSFTPTVIDMETGWTDYASRVDTGDRARLTSALVTLVNSFLTQQECDGQVKDPADRLPAPARATSEKPDAICGIEGLHLDGMRPLDELHQPLVTAGGGPVRTCDRDAVFEHPSLRLMTVEDPRLAALYTRLKYEGGPKVKVLDGGRGAGFLRDDFGFFQAECQTGEVTFLIRADGRDHAADIRMLLPRYVAAEADRIGCGPLRIKMPA
ncbi:hypothetical protein ABZ916_08865 [Streptomyces sp. NPDC046853]|uniref:hypothetical protein n=1 Tax=Streptomyces sp. NPDC046853 TaxID=3154920 RepID=UPI0033ED2489